MTLRQRVPANKEELQSYRETVRQHGIRSRTHCDGCGLPTIRFEMHEIVERSHTRGDDILRWWSYHPELVVFLCNDCHQRAGLETERYFALNITRYGLERVGNTLIQLLRLRPTILYQLQLPEVLYDYITEKRT